MNDAMYSAEPMPPESAEDYAIQVEQLQYQLEKLRERNRLKERELQGRISDAKNSARQCKAKPLKP